MTNDASMDTVSIVGRRGGDLAQADALECLRTWLARVESGEITSVAIAGTGPGRAEFGHSTYLDAGILGAAAMLQHQMLTLLSQD